jgi:hypothetical protein
MIYFKEAPISPSHIDADQFTKLAAFRKSLGTEGALCWTFNVATGDVTFEYPIIRYIAPTEKMGPWTTFPIHTTSPTLTGQATLINPGHQKEFPIYYGLMHEMFNYIFGEFMRDNIGEISVKMMDGHVISVPKAEINTASAYMRRFFEGRDLNTVVKALQAAKG